MAQRNVTTSGSHLAKALVTPTGGTTDVMLANVAQAALSVASADAAGRVELATSAETATGQDATRAVTPAGLAAQKFIKSTDVTYKALNDNGAVGSGSSQVARGNHGHAAATATTAGYLSAADKAKLDGIEAKATADQTGAEIVAAVNAELGGTQWQQGGGSGGAHTHLAADLPDRGAFYGKALGASLAGTNNTVEVNIAGLPGKAAAAGADLVPIWDPQAAAHRHVPVAGLPAGRGIVAPAGDDPAISMELPAAVDRRDFLLGFTATGAVTTTQVATAADVDEMAARGMTTIDTIAELRAYRPRRKDATVYVRGYHTPGDGGGGTFMWDVTSTANADGGTIFDGREGVGVSGRWIRCKGGNGDIRWFGARENEPASEAISNGLKAMYAGAFGVLVIPPGVWPINGVINGKVRDNTGVIAEGATFVPYSGVMGNILLSGLKSQTSTIVESGANRGSSILVLTSMTGVAIGDLIHTKSDRDFGRDSNTAPSHEKLQEFQSIRWIDVDNRKVWLDAPMIFTITPFAIGANVTCTILKVARDFFWRGGTFDCQNISEANISFEGFRNLHIQNVNFIDPLRNSLRITCSAYDKTVNCHFVGHGELQTPDQGYESINGLNFGYGLIHTTSCYSSVINCTAGRGWHAFEAAAGTRDVRYSSCAVNSNAYGFNQHPGVGRIVLDNCRSEGGLGIQAHAAEVTINGGLFRGQAISAASWRCYKLRCVGTDFEAGSSTSTLMYLAYTRMPGSILEFVGCRFKDGNVLVWADYDHVLFEDCLQINNVLEVNFKKVYFKNCTSISHRDGANVLRLSGFDGSAKEVWIDNYFSTTTQSVYEVIRVTNGTVYVRNSTFDVPRVGGYSTILTNTANGAASYWYITNCTFRSGGKLGEHATTIKLLKDCIILQGTAFMPGAGATIEHQEGNVFMEAL